MLKLNKVKRQIKFACDIINSNHLFLYRNHNSGIWTTITFDQEKIDNIVLASYDGFYVGCGLITTENIMHGSNISVYVKPEYRRLKIGTKIYQRLDRPEEITISGRILSQNFFNSANKGLDNKILTY